MLTMKKTALIACLMTSLTSGAGAADDVQRLPVENFRVLLVSAIDSHEGSAHGVLVGQMAEALTAKMKATSPILIDVTTLRRYQQPGCSRLNVRFSQDGVMLPGATTPRKQTFDLGLNYCRDGSPPKSLS
jgi:hypothetical protein